MLQYLYGSGLTAVIVIAGQQNSVASELGAGAFTRCPNLTQISLPGSLKSEQQKVFDCKSIPKIRIVTK